jgi:peptidoglycan/xylan/chitin deacetylase (PgdA/CDA1 family)
MRFTPEILKIAREFNYVTVDWNYGAKDFQPMDSDRIADYVLRQVTNGGIILLHDNPATARALPDILLGLKNRGFAVKTVGEMLRDLPEPVEIKTVGRLGEYKDERP